MKKKKIKLHFDKKVISNLTRIKGGDVIVGGTLSIAPDAQSVCLCGPTTDPNYTNTDMNNSNCCLRETQWPRWTCINQSLRGEC